MPDIDPWEAGDFDHLRTNGGGPWPCIDCGRPVRDQHSLCARCGAEAISEGEAAAIIAEHEAERAAPDPHEDLDLVREDRIARSRRRRDDHPSLTARERSPGLV